MIKRAKEFAMHAHDSIGQRRKYTKEPYWVHPEAVAKIVTDVGGTDAQIAAAWLHDTVEDTPITIYHILQEFGFEVAKMVEDLTDVSKSEDGNRATRKAIDLAHTATISADSATVKLADLIDNTKSIVQYAPGFAKIYLEEKRKMLLVLKHGDSLLWDIANKQVGE
jgi:(p)ppGpp synthase/HD superfamily hydrolase